MTSPAHVQLEVHVWHAYKGTALFLALFFLWELKVASTHKKTKEVGRSTSDFPSNIWTQALTTTCSNPTAVCRLAVHTKKALERYSIWYVNSYVTMELNPFESNKRALVTWTLFCLSGTQVLAAFFSYICTSWYSSALVGTHAGLGMVAAAAVAVMMLRMYSVTTTLRIMCRLVHRVFVVCSKRTLSAWKDHQCWFQAPGPLAVQINLLKCCQNEVVKPNK